MKKLIKAIASKLYLVRFAEPEATPKPKKEGKLTNKERLEALDNMWTGGRSDKHMLKVESGCQTIADYFELEYSCSNHNPYMWSWNYVIDENSKCGHNPTGKVGLIFMPQENWQTLMPFVAILDDKMIDKCEDPDKIREEMAEGMATNNCCQTFFAVVEVIKANMVETPKVEEGSSL
jgi:hypothetical protein